jgi:hypothetical protein
VSKRTASWLAWSMCALSLALTALGLLFHVLNLSHPGVPIFGHWVESTLTGLSAPIVGAVIASYRNENPIGWLLCASGLLFGVAPLASEYAIYTLLAVPGSLPGGEVAAGINSLWVLAFNLFVLALLLFPEGRMPSIRWRWFVRLYVTIALVEVVSMPFLPGSLEGLEPIQNPLGIESLPIGRKPVQALVFSMLFIAAASLLVRLRGAGWVERQQIKWLAYAAAMASIGSILAYTIPEIISARWVSWLGYAIMAIGVLAIPIAIGIAILRYRLFEIDLIINRTLVYGSLTGLLALFYFGIVTALQYLFSLLTGQGNTLAIVASTLAIAALFNPLRRRIQGFIDRRFYRRKYDAAMILEAFGSKLRDQTDLEKLCEDLAEVVDETMQPAHVSVILRSEFPSTTTTKEQGQQDQQTTRHEEG